MVQIHRGWPTSPLSLVFPSYPVAAVSFAYEGALGLEVVSQQLSASVVRGDSCEPGAQILGAAEQSGGA